MHKKTLMIDVDGVLKNYTKYEENFIPKMRKGAKEDCVKKVNRKKKKFKQF